MHTIVYDTNLWEAQTSMAEWWQKGISAEELKEEKNEWKFAFASPWALKYYNVCIYNVVFGRKKRQKKMFEHAQQSVVLWR